MERNNGQTIFLSVIGIATLLVAIIGATFAYFSTQLESNTAQTQVTTAKVANVTMKGFTQTYTDVLPGRVFDDETVVLATTINSGSSVEIPYTCTLTKTTSDLTDLQWRIGAKDAATSAAGTWSSAATDTTTIAGTLTAADQSDTWAIGVRFWESGTDQTEGQSNKSGTISVTCSLTGNTYYTNGYPGGTTQPGTQSNS